MRYILIFAFFLEIYSIEYEDKTKLSLAQLPLDKLLHVKNSLDPSRVTSLLNKNATEKFGEDLDAQDFIEEALPLKGDWFKTKRKKKKGNADRRDGWEEKGDKKGDLSDIFQSTVTILSFLAFGGYLLCMICMAVRNNQGMMMTTPSPTVANIMMMPSGRKRRSIVNSPMMHELFDSLVKLSEGYAKYHK